MSASAAAEVRETGESDDSLRYRILHILAISESRG